MKKVLIACQCATNKGDRAIAEYLIGQLRYYPDIEIALSTTSPLLWQSAKYKDVKIIGTGYKGFKWKSRNNLIGKVIREIEYLFYRYVCFSELIYNIRLLACRVMSKRFIDYVSDSDLVIITGGHHITSIRSKNALFSITYDIALISRFAPKYVFWSQTIGPLDFSSNRIKEFFGNILKNADSVYLRDTNSFDCINKLYDELPNLIKSYDSVFGFGKDIYDNWQDREKLIGVSIFNGLPKAERTNQYIVELLNYCISLGYKVLFFRMENSDKEQEDINMIIRKLSDVNSVSVFPFLTSAEEHLNQMAKCRCYLGYKTHSVIMSLATATPLIGICYHVKTRDFMRDFGMDNYSVIDTDLKKGVLVEMFKDLMSNAKAVHQEEITSSLRISKDITVDFRQMINKTCNL